MKPDLGALAASARHACHYCGIRTRSKMGWRNSATRDHRVPLSRGGSDTSENIVLACWRCNQVKADMTESEFRAAFRTPADIPHGPKTPNRGWRPSRLGRKNGGCRG